MPCDRHEHFYPTTKKSWEKTRSYRLRKTIFKRVYFVPYAATIGMTASVDAVKPRRRLTFPHKLFLRFLLSHFSIGANVHGYHRLAGVSRESFFCKKNPQTRTVCETVSQPSPWIILLLVRSIPYSHSHAMVSVCYDAVSLEADRRAWQHSPWRAPLLPFHPLAVEILPNIVFSGYLAVERPIGLSAAIQASAVFVSGYFLPKDAAVAECPQNPILPTTIPALRVCRPVPEVRPATLPPTAVPGAMPALGGAETPSDAVQSFCAGGAIHGAAMYREIHDADGFSREIPPCREAIRVAGDTSPACRAASASLAAVAHAGVKGVPDVLSTVDPLFPATSPDRGIWAGYGSAVFSKGAIPLSIIWLCNRGYTVIV